MTLAERLEEYVRAAFSGLWVRSFEHDDATVEVAAMCRRVRVHGLNRDWKALVSRGRVAVFPGEIVDRQRLMSR
jgi:hypothetical protein